MVRKSDYVIYIDFLIWHFLSHNKLTELSAEIILYYCINEDQASAIDKKRDIYINSLIRIGM